jgi:Zn-dependent peptidase ImmA (M78 family)
MSEWMRLKTAELKFYLQRPEYNNIIDNTIRELFESGCILLIGQSKPSLYKAEEKQGVILINVNEEKDRLHILWDLFHEYGHHFDKFKLNKNDLENSEEIKRREKTAWLFADEIFLKYPELKSEIKNYLEFRANCLASYSITDYLGKVKKN